MKKKDIINVVNERSAEWKEKSFNNEKKDIIVNFAIDVLEYAKSKNIEFDTSAGITFVSHLTTLYQRLFLTDENIEIEEDMFEQLSPELIKMSDDVEKIVIKYFNRNLNSGEKFLIATHLGSMEERIKQGITD